MMLLGAVPVTLHEFAAPTFTDGEPVRPAPTASVIEAAVQPLPDTHREWLPSGYSVIDSRLIISYSEIIAGRDGSVYADRIIHDGVTYEIVVSKEFPAFLIEAKHWECIGIRLLDINP